MAVNMLTNTPIARVSEKPLTILAPKVFPNQNRMAQVISVEKFESRMEGQAFFQPRSIEFLSDLARAQLFFNLSKISTLASTATPTLKMKPSNTRQGQGDWDQAEQGIGDAGHNTAGLGQPRHRADDNRVP